MIKPMNCSMKPPVNITLGGNEDTPCRAYGCKIFDITFPNILCPEIGEIRFKNHYVATLTVKVRYRLQHTSTERGECLKWKSCLQKVQLMTAPHSEIGSHDDMSFTQRQFRCQLTNIMALRFILQQPSPVWVEFKLENLRLFSMYTITKSNHLPMWMLDEPKEQSKCNQERELVPDTGVVSGHLQHLWALTEVASVDQTAAHSLGRFEADGCYDVNLLAYT